MSLRTIHRKLKELKKEGLVEKNNNKYSLTKLALEDLRYFNRNYAKQFGLMSLSTITTIIFLQKILKLSSTINRDFWCICNKFFN